MRDARWSRNTFISSFERQLEIREGTAKYVEVQSLSLLALPEDAKAMTEPRQFLAISFRC